MKKIIFGLMLMQALSFGGLYSVYNTNKKLKGDIEYYDRMVARTYKAFRGQMRFNRIVVKYLKSFQRELYKLKKGRQ